MTTINYIKFYSFHETQLFYSFWDNTIVYRKNPEPMEFELYAKIDTDKIAFFIVNELKLHWLKFDNKIHNIGYFSTPFYNKFVDLGDGKAAIEIMDKKYLCALPNGKSALRDWIKEWEGFYIMSAILN